MFSNFSESASLNKMGTESEKYDSIPMRVKIKHSFIN